MSRAGRRTWCCGQPLTSPHLDHCPYRATPDNPIDYGGPAMIVDTPPDPLAFPEGTEFLVEWEMPPPQVTAFDYEDRYGPDVWLRLTREQWEGLPWHPSSGRVTTNRDEALDQYRQLKRWADSHEQPIRNVKFSARRPPEWSEVLGIPVDTPPNPAPHLAGDWLGEPQPRGGRYA